MLNEKKKKMETNEKKKKMEMVGRAANVKSLRCNALS